MDVFETVLKIETNTIETLESATQSITFDPLAECETNEKDLKDEKIKANLNEVVDAVLERIKNANEIVVGISEFNTNVISRPKYQMKQKPGENKEQQEKRLMRQRIFQMKNRLLLQLKVPDKAKAEKERATLRARKIREKRKATETPEEAAARKSRQRSIVATSRKRLKELETPEQQAARIAKQNEKKKLKNQEAAAKETQEQRAARKKREQLYRDKYKQHKLAIKTGKIRSTWRNKKK